MRLEDALNEELSKVLGVNHNWMGVITKSIVTRYRWLSGNGLIDDVIADVSGDIIIQAKDGRLSLAVIRAKELSTNDADLLKNLISTVFSATMYRTRDAMKLTYDRALKASQFSQMGDGEGDFAEVVEARPESSGLELDEYTDLLVEELELMAAVSEWNNHNKMAKRLRLTKLIVVDRVQGMKLKELMEKYKISSKATMQAILDDINTAFGTVAKKVNDPVLLQALDAA